MNLKYCIDKPMRRVVALMNLYGLKTTWCCCGFDDKEKNKSHIIGQPQIWVEANDDSYIKITQILDDEIIGLTGMWNCLLLKRSRQKPMFQLFCNYPSKGNGLWEKAEDVHYHERMNCAIKVLEDRLLKFKHGFKSEVEITDQNQVMKDQMNGWVIKPAKNWKVKKEDYL